MYCNDSADPSPPSCSCCGELLRQLLFFGNRIVEVAFNGRQVGVQLRHVPDGYPTVVERDTECRRATARRAWCTLAEGVRRHLGIASGEMCEKEVLSSHPVPDSDVSLVPVRNALD